MIPVTTKPKADKILKDIFYHRKIPVWKRFTNRTQKQYKILPTIL